MEFREPFHHLGIVVIEESGLLLVQSVNRGHIVGSQFEVKDVDILANTIGVDALRNADDASLELPAKNNLGDRLAVFFADLEKLRIMEKIVLAFGKRSPAFHRDALGVQVFLVGMTLIKDVAFDLIDGRLDFIESD